MARRFLLHSASVAAAAMSFAAYEHLKVQGATTASTVALVSAAVLGLSPIRLVLHAVFAVKGAVLHFVHAAGGLAFIAMTLSGLVSGRPVLDRAAVAPFTLLSVAESVMGPSRSADQDVALRRFVTGISNVRELRTSGTLGATTDVRHSVAILGELVARAQALGDAERRSDPRLQSAFVRGLLRAGVSLELDSVDETLRTLGTNPAAASSVAELRKRLAAARRTLDR